jgi:5-methylcytosine-specific restriction endonuclease McrA
MTMPTPDQYERWRVQFNARYARNGQRILSQHHARGMPCRGCGTMRAVASKDRARVEAAGGPLCHECRRVNRPEPVAKVCDQCGQPTDRVGNQNGRFCIDCAADRYCNRDHALDFRRKCGGSDLTTVVVRAMKASALRCPLCECVMVDRGMTPRSKELDHLIPICVGGRHTRANARIICRRCNQRRPKDGRDYHGPVTLEMWGDHAVVAQPWMMRAVARGDFHPRVPVLLPL